MNEIVWEDLEANLEAAGPLRFEGNERELAEQWFLATSYLADRAYSGGQVGIDYEQLMGMPRSEGGGGDGFGGWLIRAVPTLHELRRIGEEACANIEPWQVDAWISVRQASADRETVRQVAERTGIPKSTVHNAVAFLDRCLAGRLRARDYVVRGQR